jgi:hypothetical protein
LQRDTSPYNCDYEPAPTPTGLGVVITPEDSETGTSPVTLTFEEVTESGYTSLATSDSGPTPPSGFELGEPPTYYDITTTAITAEDSQIEVCIDYSDITFTDPPEALRLYHYDDTVGGWVDCTVSVDTTGQLIYGLVTSLSPFAIFTDVEAPTVNSISADPEVLWPANHKMVDVTVTVEAEDNSEQKPMCMIVKVTSNESANDQGDGNTDPDWEFTDDPLVVLLRAERDGGGTGRVYTIDVACMDAAGNVAYTTVDVTVPHDQGAGKKK